MASDKQYKTGFNDGYICAVQNILMLFDEPQIAEEVLQQLGLSESQFRREWRRARRMGCNPPKTPADV